MKNRCLWTGSKTQKRITNRTTGGTNNFSENLLITKQPPTLIFVAATQFRNFFSALKYCYVSSLTVNFVPLMTQLPSNDTVAPSIIF